MLDILQIRKKPWANWNIWILEREGVYEDFTQLQKQMK